LTLTINSLDIFAEISPQKDGQKKVERRMESAHLVGACASPKLWLKRDLLAVVWMV
jgi:hypothetical protein